MTTELLPEPARHFRALMRRADAKALAAALGVARRTFEAWCVEPPPLPEGVRLRHQPPGQVRHIYPRQAIVWLASQSHPTNP